MPTARDEAPKARMQRGGEISDKTVKQAHIGRNAPVQGRFYRICAAMKVLAAQDSLKRKTDSALRADKRRRVKSGRSYNGVNYTL